jgi:hypothetical protein
MKFVILAAALLVAAPLSAQTAPAPAAAAAMLTIDSPIEALVADPKAKAVVDANFPGMTAHPAYEQFKGMSVKQLQPMSQGVITDEAVKKAEAELAAAK